MPSKYTFRGVADMTQHNAELQKAASEVYKYKKRVKDAESQLKNFTGSIQGTISGIKGLSSNLSSGNILGFAQGLRGLIPTMGAVTAGATGMGAALNLALGPVGLITAAIAAVGAVTVTAIKSVEEFNGSLRGLSALTGVKGQALEEYGKDAVDMSMQFGTSATSIIDSMKKIGSASPELLKNKEALEGVTKSSIVLAKASEMTVEDTSKAITTAMNQFGLAGNQSDRIINTMAAASQAGAGDVNYLTTALEKVGTHASNANLSFEETTGIIETLAPKFSSADVAGTALSGVLISLSTQANDNFNPKIVGLSAALDNLAKANLSAKEKTKLFGREGLAAAEIMIAERDGIKNMTAAVTNSNSAYEQMETQTGGLNSLMGKLKAAWDGLMISLGQTFVVKAIIIHLGVLGNIVRLLIKGLKWLVDVFNTTVSILQALTKKLWYECIKPIWDKIVNAITNSAIYKKCAQMWQAIMDAAKTAIQWISDKWHKFLQWLGLESKNLTINGGTIKIKKVVDDNKGGNDDGNDDGKGKGGKGKGGKGTGGNFRVNKIEFAKGSLDDLEKQLGEAQKRLSSGLFNKEETKESLNALISDLQKQIKNKKIELGLEPTIEEGSEKALQEKVNKLKDKISSMSVSNPLYEYTKTQLALAEDDLEEIQKKNTTVGFEIKPTIDKGSLKDLETRISKKKAILETKVYGSEDYYKLTNELKELTDKKHKIELQIEADGLSKIEKLKKDYSKGVDKYRTITEPINGLDSTIGSMDSLIKKIEEGGNAWEIFISMLQMVDSVLSTIQDTIEAVSTVMDAMKTSTEAATTASNVATATDSANTQVQVENSLAKTSASGGEAIAGATASGAKMPFPYNLIAIAAGVAAVMAALSNIASFADGGIINGRTSIGDYNLARVNGGEMILNSRHQNNLFRAIDQNRLGSGGAVVGGEIRIKGQDLYVALKNYSKVQNKLGKNTGIL